MDLIRKLKKLLSGSGLSEEEIQFYITVLKHSNCSIFDISKKAKLSKDKAYLIYESLKDKKLVDDVKAGAISKIKALPFDSYIQSLQSKSRSLYRTADNLKELGSILPILDFSDKKGIFKTFQNDEAAEKFIDMSYCKGDEILFYGEYDDILKKFGEECDKEFLKNRLKKGKKCYPVVANPDKYTWDNLVSNDNHELRQTKVLFNDMLKDYFVILVPQSKTMGFWMKSERDQVHGGIIESEMITGFHQQLYNYFDSISKYQVSRKIEESKNK